MKETDDYDESEGKKAVKEFSWMPAGCSPLADGEYDAIILGTGLTECTISGLLSVSGKRVLHLDRNNYYGAETASLGLVDLYKKFRDGEPAKKELGHPRNWNVDLVPKFIMACGKLVKILLHSKVTRYLEFKSIDGSYVFKDGKVQKNYDKEKPSTWLKGKRLDQVTTKDLYAEYGLDANTQAFTGHAMALHRDDDYLDQPAEATAEAIQLYAYSLERYGKSPYIYPLYGLGGLPEGFSRLAAVNGGVYMLNKGVDEILLNEDGVAWGIKTDNEVAKAPIIVGDPSYFSPSKSRLVGKVVRSICILDHPIAGTDNAESVQIIIPASQVKRRNDIYVCMVSSTHNVSADGTYIAICSTTVETSNPLKELEPGFALLGKVLERFDAVSDLLDPVSDGVHDKCFISKSYDATQEMFKECTFRPNIKPLPSSYGAMKDSGTPFHARVTKWSKDKEAEVRKKTLLMEQNEVAECTFRPKISRNSERAIREMRGSIREDVGDRLYKSSSLYAEQRYRLIEEERVREDNEEKTQCTFQPKLFTKRFNETSGINPRYSRPQSASAASLHNMQNETARDHNSKECTFTPQINKIKPNMSSAKLYVSTNVVERLSRTNGSSTAVAKATSDDSIPRVVDTTFVIGDSNTSGRAGAVIDITSFMSNLTGPQKNYQTPSSNSAKPSESEPQKSRELTEEELKERQKKFETFLNRQQQILKRKEDNVRVISEATAPKFQPKFCKKSIEMTEEKFANARFLDRVDKDVQRRLSTEQNLSVNLEKECTFQPKINEKSEKLRPRTAFELSRGDFFRKETNRRMLKMQNDELEQSALTFQPKLSAYAENAKSALQLNNDPSYFLDWFKEKVTEKENLRQLELQRRAEEEVSNCTFSPKTIDCPEYVKRIAKSMSIVKSARSTAQPEEPEKPDWR
eukprot:gene23463-31808_t